MRTLHAQTLAVLLGAATLVGAAPPWGLPAPAPVPDKMPAPSPAVVVGPLTITPDNQLVVQYKTERTILVRPVGTLKVTKEIAPFNVRGRFADGPGTVERRSYEGPHVYTLEVGPVPHTGPVYVDAIASLTDIDSAVVQVEAGEGPIPPPKPKPKDDAAPVVTSFRVLLLRDPLGTMTLAQAGVYDSQAVARWLNEHCTKDGVTPGWRRYGKDQDASGEFPDVKALWAATKPKLTTLPCLAIEVNGKVDIIDFPATEADALTTLKTYRGIK